MTRYTIAETDLGRVGLALSERGVRAVTMPHAQPNDALAALFAAEPEVGEPLAPAEAAALHERLRAFLAGENEDLGVPLDLRGTPFQQAVWQAVAEIPRGQTRSYGWIAERVGRPGAARAVGQAVGANPAPLLVPCHRVVASGGGLGGFGGGLPMKRALLAAEGVTVA